MRKNVLALAFLLIAGQMLMAVPGLGLHYAGTAYPGNDHNCRGLHQPTGNLWFYRLIPSDNGFGIEGFYINTSCAMSATQTLYTYQHPVPLDQDGGEPVFVLAKSFLGRVFYLQKNSLHLFMTVIDEEFQATTVVTNNPGLSFSANPISNRSFCFLTPQLMILSSQGSVYLLNLQTGVCSYYWNFPNSIGTIALTRLDDQRVIMSAYIDWQDQASYLLNHQTMTRTEIYYGGWSTDPISADFGDSCFLVKQSRYDFDGLDLVRTLLMRVNANNMATLYPLYYGGSTNFFDYTPQHTFEAVHLLGDNRFLAICTDLFMIPQNRRLGMFQVVGNEVEYILQFPELNDLNNPSRLYKIQDGYFLSYHSYTPAATAARLLDLEGQAISLPDSNLIVSPVDFYTTGNNAFYAIGSGNQAHVYHLVEPSSSPETGLAPPAGLSLRAWPNPFQNKVMLEVSSRLAAEVQLSVFDLRGRLVRRLWIQSGNEGKRSLEWDGRDEKGGRLPAGIYLVKASSGIQEASARIVLLP